MAAPATMNAIYYEQYGEFDAVLKQGQLPVPQPKPDEVQVHVRAASLNPVDWKFTKGYLKNWIPKTFPAVPGFDVSGVVSAVGAEVQGFKVGDEVYADGGFEGSGSLAEYVTLPGSCLSHKPKTLSWEDAASIPLTFLTSYQALVDTAKLKAGAKVVVLGGSGGCGTAAIQIAKALGAWVATTTSAANTEFVKGLGADQAIDYTSKKWEEELKGTEIDIVYDTVGTEGSWEAALTLLKKGGVFVGIAGPRKESTADHTHAIIITVAKKGTEQLPIAEKFLAEGKYKPLVSQVFAFTQAQAVEMFNKSASSRTTGKLVMKIQA